MIVFSSDHGKTLVDKVPSWVTDKPQVEEVYIDEFDDEEEYDPQAIQTEMTWSGCRWDYYSNN